ncbi:MAG: DUF4435 domain-containing protein [Clostridia bacterium]|nr:DUF4435 domain-containing protein [Clostridia bacterium]
MKEKIEEQTRILNEILVELESIEKALNSKEETITFKIKDRSFVFGCEVLQNSRLGTINIKEIKNSLNKMLKRNEKIINGFEKNIKQYNEQYINYLINETTNISNYYSNYLRNKTYYLDNNRFIDIQVDFFQNLNQIINQNLIELYEYFKYGNKNYIIFGKNGAGKTTLLHNIAGNILNQNSFVIPAYRSLKCDSNSVYQGERTSTNLNSIFTNEKAIDILIVKMIKREQDELIKAHQLKTRKTDNTIIEKFCEIFSQLGIERKIKINREQEKAMLYDDGIMEYSLSSASDGEKIIAYTIMAILLLPQNGYIFIDEPENHLNGTLMIELFNKLEEVRDDLKFVYLTHNIDFIESRANVELIYLEKTKKVNTWKFKEIQNFNDIDLDIILSIEGAKKDIIFCEGNNNTSIDYKIYSNIYKDFLVMPVSSCEKVIENVKVINSNPHMRRKAYGILDNDFKSINEIQSLNSDNIFVLDKNEIEDVLLSEKIIEKVNELNTNEVEIDNVKKYVINFVKENKKIILKDFVNKKYNKIIKTSNIKYEEELEREIDEINQKNKEQLIQEINKLESNIEIYIQNEDYEKILNILPGKTIIKTIVRELGFSDEKAYIAFLINQIRINEEFRQIIVSKLPVIK